MFLPSFVLGISEFFLLGRLVISESTFDALKTDWSKGVKKCLLGLLSFDKVSLRILAIELKSLC